MGRRVGLTYNLKKDYVFKPGDPPDANAEFDHEDTIGVIEDAIRGGGHDVVRLGTARSLLNQVELIKTLDIVFNLAEGDEGRNRESQVPIILEMLRVPCVGADGLTLGLTLDKILTKKILIAEGVPTPRFAELRDASEVWKMPLEYPLIVKPRYEGSSKGLRKASRVANAQELAEQVGWVTSTYKQPALVEEFIEGQEFTVAIIGNNPPQVQPITQIQIEGKMDLGDLFYTFEHIRSGANYITPAPIDEALRQRLADVALKTYQAVECLDFGRVDIRVDRRDNPYVLEINPLPSLSTEDVFMCVAKALGISFEEIIRRVLDAALVRCGLQNPSPASGARSARA